MINKEAFHKAVYDACAEAIRSFALGNLVPKSEYLTVDQMCDELDFSRPFADKLIREEGLPVIRIGRTIRIRRVALEAWLEAREHVTKF